MIDRPVIDIIRKANTPWYLTFRIFSPESYNISDDFPGSKIKTDLKKTSQEKVGQIMIRSISFGLRFANRF
jgi:hypothetical protein